MYGHHKRHVFDREGGQCLWCGLSLSRDPEAPEANRATIDHVIPQAMGGTHDLENLVLCCPACNQRRSRELSVWLKARGLDENPRTVAALTSTLPDAPPDERRAAYLQRQADEYREKRERRAALLARRKGS